MDDWAPLGLPVVRWAVVGAARGAFVARCTVRVGCFSVCSLLQAVNTTGFVNTLGSRYRASRSHAEVLQGYTCFGCTDESATKLAL